MALMKQGQGLVETSQEEIQKQTGFTPLSPGAVKAQGGTPQQAAMAGTPAAKQSLYKPLEDTQKTLQNAQRQTQLLDKQRQQSQDQAAAKMDRLKQLGTMGAQIEGLIQQRLGTQQGATSGLATQNIAAPVINQAAIDLLPETQRAAAAAALQAYSSAADVNAKQQALVSLSTTLGRPVTDADIGNYFQQLPELATAAAKQAVGTSITLGNLQPSWLNMQQTAADLGVTEAELQGYSPEQLQAKLQEVESNEYNRIANLKAEYATAVGARKAQIQTELTQLGQAGATGTEAQFDRMQQAIDEGQTLMIAGEEMSIEDILTKDSISNLISDATTNPQKLAELKKTPGYEALASWIETNQAELNELATGMRSEVRAFGDVQTGVSNIQTELGALASTILGEVPKYATQEQLTALQDTLNASGLYQSVKADPAFKAMLTADPKLAEQLKDKSKEEIDELKSISDMVKNNGDIAAEFGFTEGEFITDPAKADAFVATASVLAEAPEEVDAQQKIDIARMVADGDITADIVASMMQHPEEIDDVVSENASIKEYNAVKDDFDKFSEWAFGGQSVQATNDILSSLKLAGDYGDVESKKLYERFASLVGDDGVLDKTDMSRLQAAISTSGLGNISVGGKTIAEKMADLKKMADAAYARVNDPAITAIRNVVGDGIVSFDDLVAPDALKDGSTLRLLANNGYLNAHFPEAMQHIKNIDNINNIFKTSNPALGQKFVYAMKDGVIDSAEVKKYAKNMTIDELQKLVDSGLKMQNITKREVVSSVLGHNKYGDVVYDARADLQKILDSKAQKLVDDLAKAEYGTTISSARTTSNEISSLFQQAAQNAGADDLSKFFGDTTQYKFNSTSSKQVKAAYDSLAGMSESLRTAIAGLQEKSSTLPGATKTAVQAEINKLTSLLRASNWAATHKFPMIGWTDIIKYLPK